MSRMVRPNDLDVPEEEDSIEVISEEEEPSSPAPKFNS